MKKILSFIKFKDFMIPVVAFFGFFLAISILLSALSIRSFTDFLIYIVGSIGLIIIAILILKLFEFIATIFGADKVFKKIKSKNK